MTDHKIKKLKQYTIRGIQTGAYDDDLDKLLRAVQRRRADVGQIKVVRLGPGGKTKVEEPVRVVSGEPVESDQPTMRWDYNQNKLTGEAVYVLDKLYEAHREGVDITNQPVRAPMTRYSYPMNNSFSIDDVWYSKSEAKNRIFALHDEAAEDTGIAAMYVVSVARRNFTGYPLQVSSLATSRKVNAVRKKAYSDMQVTLAPECFADFYANSSTDPLWNVVFHGQSQIYPN